MEIKICKVTGNWKTEFCMKWIMNQCPLEDKCTKAHDQDELTLEALEANKTKDGLKKKTNCRNFWVNKFCKHGTDCMFRHEHRTFRRMHRHHYTPQLFTLETLYETIADKKVFEETYTPATQRLPVFAHFHAIPDKKKCSSDSFVSQDSFYSQDSTEDAGDDSHSEGVEFDLNSLGLDFV